MENNYREWTRIKNKGRQLRQWETIKTMYKN